jgi:hypothetical protein
MQRKCGDCFQGRKQCDDLQCSLEVKEPQKIMLQLIRFHLKYDTLLKLRKLFEVQRGPGDRLCRTKKRRGLGPYLVCRFVYDTDISKGNVRAETANSGFIFVDYLTLSSFSINGLLKSVRGVANIVETGIQDVKGKGKVVPGLTN